MCVQVGGVLSRCFVAYFATYLLTTHTHKTLTYAGLARGVACACAEGVSRLHDANTPYHLMDPATLLKHYEKWGYTSQG